MAPSRAHNRASEFDDLTDQAPKDFDPEADDIPDDDASESADDVSDEAGDGAREHYVDVGKSKLRKPKTAPLGPQYRGSKISRDAVSEDEDEEDPFSRGFDDEESEDEDLLESEDADSDEDEEDEETPGTDVSDEDEQFARDDDEEQAAAMRRNVAKQLAADDRKSVAAALLKANTADAEKGRAVKAQRTAFDSLLGTRMKLQKSLIGANTLAGMSAEGLKAQRQEGHVAIEAAETAAFNLWSSLNSFREEVIAARTGMKRKRGQFDVTTPSEDLWSYMQAQDDDSIDRRKAVLQKWSAKAKGVGDGPSRSRLNASAPQSTILDVIQEQFSNSERLLKRAHTPRSCAPVQLANKVTEDDRIYDDADFYGLLLKELLEAKSADSVAASNIDVSFQMRREAKTKKNVDTKASKGRKLRYTVHEKLQNFMAPEDRGMWGERQTDELFGSLFGQRLGLAEGREDDEDDQMEGADGVDPAEEALMLFRR